MNDSIVIALKLKDSFPVLVKVLGLFLFLAGHFASLQYVSVLFYKLFNIPLDGAKYVSNLIFLVSNVISTKAYFQCNGFPIIVESQFMCI